MSEICIIGGGAVGGTLAYFLYRGLAKAPAVIYRSNEAAKLVRESRGIVLIDKTRGAEYLVPVEAYSQDSALLKCDIVLNAVKALDVPHTIPLMRRLGHADTLFLMLQNGFGSLELAESSLGIGVVGGGVVYFGSERIAPNEVVYYGGNTIILGTRRGISARLTELAASLSKSGLDARIASDIDLYRWLKLALNSVVNPLTAITRARNGIVLADEARALARLILEEVVMAASKFGYQLDVERLISYVMRNAEMTSSNLSSMAQDVISGKPTEVDYINGFVADVLGYPNSLNNVLRLLVKLIEKSYNLR